MSTKFLKLIANGRAVGEVRILNKKHNMEAEDLLDKFAQDEGFGNWETIVLNCHHSVIRSVAIAAVNQALRQPPVIASVCACTNFRETPMINGKHICSICNKPIVQADLRQV